MLIKMQEDKEYKNGIGYVKEIIFDFDKGWEYSFWYDSKGQAAVKIDKGEAAFYYHAEAAETLWVWIMKQHQEQEAGDSDLLERGGEIVPQCVSKKYDKAVKRVKFLESELKSQGDDIQFSDSESKKLRKRIGSLKYTVKSVNKRNAHLESELSRTTAMMNDALDQTSDWQGQADEKNVLEKSHKEACDLLRGWIEWFDNKADLGDLEGKTADFLGLD